jgi:hypothetical protein
VALLRQRRRPRRSRLRRLPQLTPLLQITRRQLKVTRLPQQRVPLFRRMGPLGRIRRRRRRPFEHDGASFARGLRPQSINDELRGSIFAPDPRHVCAAKGFYARGRGHEACLLICFTIKPGLQSGVGAYGSQGGVVVVRPATKVPSHRVVPPSWSSPVPNAGPWWEHLPAGCEVCREVPCHNESSALGKTEPRQRAHTCRSRQ